jgi:ligand-binding SRPBCC domain-containing protein
MPAHAYRIERSQTVSRPVEDVFAFFADPSNLERITPAFLQFRILTPLPIAFGPGAVIEYELRLHGIPFRWKTLIEVVDPPRRFVDSQLRGPYRRWLHIHSFRSAPGGGTIVEDLIEYEMPLGPLGRLARALFVRRSLERIFDHRREAIARIFPAERASGRRENGV